MADGDKTHRFIRNGATRVRLYEGVSGSGKTHRLLIDARRLIEAAGTDVVASSDTDMADAAARTATEVPASPDVLFVTASAQGAHMVRRALGSGAAHSLVRGLRVVSAEELCAQLLADEEVRSFTGRSGRMLLPFEERFLMTDLETSGLHRGRLKNMVAFFRRCWANLDDLEPGWLCTTEEEVVHGLLKDCLQATGGVLREEAPNLLVRCLLEKPEIRARFSADTVLVDDFLLLSRATQCLLHLLAKNEFLATGNTTCTAPLVEAYPNAQGFTELGETGEVERVVLDYPGTCLAARLSTRLLDAPVPVGSVTSTSLEHDHPETDIVMEHGLVELTTPTLDGEAETIASFVEQRLAAGARADGIYLASPHRDWTRAVARRLSDKGIETEIALEPRHFAWPIDDDRKNTMPRALTILALAANPRDDIARRSWLGLGIPKANNGAVRYLRLCCEGMPLGEALDIVAKAAEAKSGAAGVPDTADAPAVGGLSRWPSINEALELESVMERRAALATCLKSLDGLQGETLVQAIAAFVVPADRTDETAAALSALCSPIGTDRTGGNGHVCDLDAAELFANACHRALFPRFEEPGAVRVGPLSRACECDPDIVVLMGFVGGFAPTRDVCDAVVLEADKRSRRWHNELSMVYLAASSARKELVCSSFALAGLEEAERYELKIDRVRVKNGERVAAIPKSPWIYSLR